MKFFPFITEIIILSGIVLSLLFFIISKRNFYFYAISLLTHILAFLSEYILLKRNIFYEFQFLSLNYETRVLSQILILVSLISLLLFWLYKDKFILKETPFLILNSLFSMVLLIKSNNLFFSFLTLEYLSFNIYIFIASFKEMGLSYESALKYFVLGSFSSLLMLFGIFLLYLDKGNLTYSVLKEAKTTPFLILALIFIFSGFAFKLAFVPFHIWTPDVFAGTPFPFISFISTAPKIAMFGLFFFIQKYINFNLLNIAFISIITMFLGNFSALVQKNIKKIFAFSSIAHSGYILFLFLSRKKFVLDVLAFYLFVYSISQLGALFVFQQFEDENISLNELKEKASLFISFSLLIFLLSLTGIPPTAGFYAKFYLFSMPLAEGYRFFVFIAFLNSVISAYYYMRIGIEVFIGRRKKMYLAGISYFLIFSLALITILLGVYPSFINILLK